MSTSSSLPFEDFREELAKAYPSKVGKKRMKSMIQATPGEPREIQANVRTVPGIISQRGCTYAGCKGVVLGPTRDIVNITHGPIGCGFYSWLTRRNQTRPETPESENYMTYCFSTDMQDEHIVFGGETRLKEAIQEAYDLFHPKAIAVFSTCPVGLIGDDVHAVSREMKAKFGDCNVFGFSCEGYKGVSQSAGHHIANNQIFKHVVGTEDEAPEGEFRVNLLGEYNIGGDAFEIEELFEACGITLVSTFSGNSTVSHFARAHHADLNLVMCHRSINYLAEMLETKYGIPWMKVNFIGAAATAKALRKVGEYFGDESLKARIEKVVSAKLAESQEYAAEVRQRTQGKTAMLFVGGSRAHHYQELFKELGMKTIAAGYEFGHRDDYEGRKVIPDITIDADTRNIEELKVERDPDLYRERKTEAELEALKAKGLEIADYEGMIPDMDPEAFVIDDVSHYELEKLMEHYKPDLICAGIKEKYAVQKWGVPLKQLHNYDYGGPYAAFGGARNFYEEIDRMVNSKLWDMVTPPWLKPIEPRPVEVL